MAELLAKEKTECVLIGRNAGRLEAVAKHLRILGTRATTLAVKENDNQAIAAAWPAIQAEGPVDLLLVAQGMLPGDCALSGGNEVEQTLRTNTVEPIVWCQTAAPDMQVAGRGTIAVIGSVAGDRGRLKNHIYSAAKKAVEIYCQGLRLRLAPAVKVCLIKPGITETGMTDNLPPSPLTFPAEIVAAHALRAIRKGKKTCYCPPIWGWVMRAVRNLPDWALRKSGI